MASEVVIYGASDDLVEVTGDIDEEFYVEHGEGGVSYLALSNGVLLKIKYDGDWNIRLASATHEAGVTIEPAHGHDDPNARDYSDVATVTSEAPVRWAMIGAEAVIDGD